jgi:hypothetical protein
VVGELDVAGSKAVIGHGVQWSLSDGLNLTIPRDMETIVLGLLCKARGGLLGGEDLDTFAADWDMLTVEMCAEGEAMPGLFLIRRDDLAAIVISAWPKLPSCAASVPRTFDAASFFKDCTSAVPPSAKASFCSADGHANTLVFREGRLEWEVKDGESKPVQRLGIAFRAGNSIDEEYFRLSGPFGCAVVSDPAPGQQRDMVEEIVKLCLDHGIPVSHVEVPDTLEHEVAITGTSRTSLELSNGSLATCGSPVSAQLHPVSKGDNVEVQFEGEWFSGVLQGVEGGFALVSCDVDDPDIITVAPLRKVRAASSFDGHKGEHGTPRHQRIN